MKLFEKKKKCLICGEKCGNIYTTVKYRYEDEKIGEVYVCEKCSEQYDVEKVNDNVEPI